MGRRRRKDEGSPIEQLMDALIGISREAPLIGLGLSALIFAVGAWLFWGDPKRMHGMAAVAGILPLLVGTLAGLFAVACLVRERMTPRRSNPREEQPPSPRREAAKTRTETPAETRTEPPPPDLPVAPPVDVPRDGRAFERWVAGHFRMQGYLVEETGTHGRGGDRGVDLLMWRPDAPAAARVCVQCKDYAAWKVGAEAVRAFAGAVALRGQGHVGWIVTSGRFTADAIRDAKQLEIRLIDGEAWDEMTKATGTDALKETIPPRKPVAVDGPGASPPREADVPLCPRCRTPMVRRVPKAGGKQFRPFWGCQNYPRCRETVDIA